MPRFRIVMAYEVKADAFEDATKLAAGLKEPAAAQLRRGWVHTIMELPDE